MNRKRLGCSVCVLAAALAVAALGRASAAQASGTAAGTISTDTEWSGGIHVTGTVTVAAGATLTIDAGTHVLLDPGVSIVVDGALRANGAPGASGISFGAATGTYWGQILGGAGSSVQLDYATLDRAGTDPTTGVRPLQCEGCRMTVDDSMVQNEASANLSSVYIDSSPGVVLQRDTFSNAVHLVSGDLVAFGLTIGSGGLLLDAGTAEVWWSIVGGVDMGASGNGGTFALHHLDAPSGTISLESGQALVTDSIVHALSAYAYPLGNPALDFRNGDFPDETGVVAHEGTQTFTAEQLGSSSADPLFVSWITPDYHLQPASPLLSASNCGSGPCPIGALGTSGPLESAAGDPTTTQLSVSPASGATAADTVTLTATVEPRGANVVTGEVTFTDGFPGGPGLTCIASCVTLGTATLGPDGTATVTTSLPAGDHALFASFSGSTDPNSGQPELGSLSDRHEYQVAAAPTPAVSLDPGSVDFGTVDVGSTGTATVTLTNSGTAALHFGTAPFDAGGAPFSVGGDASPGTCNAIGSGGLAAGASCTITVVFAPTQAGAATGSLAITDDAADSPQQVGLSGSGRVVDTTPPVITPHVAGTAGNGGWYRGDVTVTWDVSDAESAVSSTSGCDSVTVSTDTGLAGVTFTCSATSEGGTASKSVTVLRDATPPPAPTIAVPADGARYLLGQRVNASYSCDADVASGIGSCTGPVASGAALPTNAAGPRTFAVTATDVAGNATTATASYAVGYAAAGTKCLDDPGHVVLEPIAADGGSVFKTGKAVAVKFRVCDALGRSVGTPGVVASFKLVQTINGGTTTAVDQTPVSATGDAGFVWDRRRQEWVFNLSTKGLQAGTTYVYEIRLDDGSTIGFRFRLR